MHSNFYTRLNSIALRNIVFLPFSWLKGTCNSTSYKPWHLATCLTGYKLNKWQHVTYVHQVLEPILLIFTRLTRTYNLPELDWVSWLQFAARLYLIILQKELTIMKNIFELSGMIEIVVNFRVNATSSKAQTSNIQFSRSDLRLISLRL